MMNPVNANHGAPRRPVLLIVLDGFGSNPNRLSDTIAAARTPRLDDYFSRYSHTLLQASGQAVGLPPGQMGNSEVGHLTLGCGSVIRQDLVRIDDAISSGEFFTNPALNDALEAAAASRRPIHLLGLVSEGGVHSHMRHLLALIRLCRQHGVVPLLHMITDGRDAPPRSALTYLDNVEPVLLEAGGAVATIIGRYFAMDRDQRWDRTERAWRALVLNEGRRCQSAQRSIENSYGQGITDEFIEPVILSAAVPLQADDQVICFNFRKDRPRQIVAALGLADFDGFDRGSAPCPRVTCLMPYNSHFGFPYAFAPEAPSVTLAQTVSEAGLRQFHCAESEKYAHVTYFFNGGRSEPFPEETRVLVPSPQVATYDLQPEMSAREVADAAIEALDSGEYAFLLVNFANGDMVGHTARREAVIEAIETLDREAGRLIAKAEAAGYAVILTADHGNCEELRDPRTDVTHTQHTTYPVPCLVIDEAVGQLYARGGLANVAPTVLQLLGIDKPSGMLARSLILTPADRREAPQSMVGAA